MAFWKKWFGGKPAATKGAPTALTLDSTELHQLLLGSRPTSGTVSVDDAMRLSSVYTCVKIIAETIGTMPCYLHARSGDKGEISEWNVDNPLFDVIADRPNHFQTAPEFWMYVTASLLLHGDFYARIVRVGNNRRVHSLLPIASEMVQPRLTSNYEVQYLVDGKPVKADEILHIKGLSLDAMNGTSVIQYNASTINAGRYARDFSNTVFTNNGTPRGILSTDAVLNDESYENISSSWNENHQGVDNWNKVAILEQGLKFTQISLSPADAELILSQKYTRSEIAGMFRVPPHMIGDLERSTNNNIEHQSLEFFRDAIAPWLKLIESRLNFQLLGTRANFFKFDTDALIQGDTKGQVDLIHKLVTIGVINPNEGRQRLGLNPREGGDEYIVQTNNLSFDDEDKDPEKEPNESE